MEKMITMRIRVVIFMPFFPRSLYSTRTVATEIIEGMILSNRSATARLTSPIWNARGVFAVTTVADRAPTTVRPRTEAASVMRASLPPTLVISLSRSSGCGCASWFDALFLNPINWYNDQYIQKMERYASWFRRSWKARIPADVRAASISGCCLRLRDNNNCRFPPGGHRSARLSLRSSNGGKLPGATGWSVR